MRRAIPLLALLAFATLLAGCPKGGGVSAQDRMLLGTWEDAGGARYTFGVVDGALRVISVVDSDGEVFPVTQSGWSGGLFSWTYTVPSTGYVVVHEITTLLDGQFNVNWSNAYDSGTDVFYRVQ